jgi:hypothetical protein
LIAEQSSARCDQENRRSAHGERIYRPASGPKQPHAMSIPRIQALAT